MNAMQAQHALEWFQLLQSLGIIGGLTFTGYQIFQSTRSRNASHMLEITAAHRTIWSIYLQHSDLKRVTEKDVDIMSAPVSDREKMFISLLILHLNCVVELISRKMIVPIEELASDVEQFFLLPIPRSVWNEVSHLQNSRLILLVEKGKIE